MQAASLLTFIILVLFSPFSSAHDQNERSSGSCFGSGSEPEVQICGTEGFYCPVDSQCKDRSLRCSGANVCIHPNTGMEGNCDSSNRGYYIKLGRTSLFSGRKRLETNHQLLSYRGFVYEFGCGYGVQILDLNDPRYKYGNTVVDFETQGTSECTYDQALIFTYSWSRRYNLFTHNCQHFASELSRYLMSAQCRNFNKRDTADLSEFADNLIANCTECCEVEADDNAARAVIPMLLSLLVPLISLLVQ